MAIKAWFNGNGMNMDDIKNIKMKDYVDKHIDGYISCNLCDGMISYRGLLSMLSRIPYILCPICKMKTKEDFNDLENKDFTYKDYVDSLLITKKLEG